ncbi:MAG: hypothetical protein C0490_22045 [Marivirga sp.]|nr:hypothetical protein [Marivirga sp.]
MGHWKTEFFICVVNISTRVWPLMVGGGMEAWRTNSRRKVFIARTTKPNNGRRYSRYASISREIMKEKYRRQSTGAIRLLARKDTGRITTR